MSSIVGIVSKKDEPVERELSAMIRSIWNDNHRTFLAVTENRMCVGNSPTELGLSNIGGSKSMAEIYDGSSGILPSAGVHNQDKKDMVLLSDIELYSRPAVSECRKRKVDFDIGPDENRLMQLLSVSYKGELEPAVSKVMKKIDGTFAMAAFDGRDMVIARDINGIKQLYMAQKDSKIAFSTDKKALWSIGFNDIERIPPGHTAKISDEGVVMRSSLRYPSKVKKDVTDIGHAVREYERTLVRSIGKRVRGLDRVGVVFSGGIDSVLVAHIASKFVDVTCYCAGLKGSEDIKAAIDAAEQMGLKIKVREFDIAEAEEDIPKVIAAIEDRQFLQVEAAMPVFIALKLAKEDGQTVVLNGQGADELFGGYPWYRVVLEKEGYPKLEHYMWDDFLHGHSETFERETKMAKANGLRLRIPYTDPEIVNLALRIDSRLKVRSPDDVLGKFVHRELAKRLGIPLSIANRLKEAAQHGSGAHETLMKIASEKGFDDDSVHAMGYDQEKSIREKLGSSIRYGYKYSEKELWTVPDHVQLYLDTIALENDLIGQDELQYISGLKAGH